MKKRRCAALLTLKLAIVLAEGELRGSELAEARAWIARRRDDAPDITDLQRAFLSASEAAEEARIGAERQRLAWIISETTSQYFQRV